MPHQVEKATFNVKEVAAGRAAGKKGGCTDVANEFWKGTTFFPYILTNL